MRRSERAAKSESVLDCPRSEGGCLPSKKPEDEGENDACQDTGYDGEVEGEIALGDLNVTREPAEPAFSKTRPQ